MKKKGFKAEQQLRAIPNKCNAVFNLRYLNNIMLTLLRRYRFSKVAASAKEALKGLKSGQKLLVGGFGLSGIPMNLIHEV